MDMLVLHPLQLHLKYGMTPTWAIVGASRPWAPKQKAFLDHVHYHFYTVHFFLLQTLDVIFIVSLQAL